MVSENLVFISAIFILKSLNASLALLEKYKDAYKTKGSTIKETRANCQLILMRTNIFQKEETCL